MSNISCSRLSLYSACKLFAVLLSMSANTTAQAWQYNDYPPYPNYRPVAVNQSPYRFYPVTYYHPYARSYPSNRPAYTYNRRTRPESSMQAPKPNENTQTKKREFIEKLLPTVQRENSKLRQLHQHLQQVIQGIHSTYGISRQSRHWLQNLARRYQVKGDPVTEKQAQLELLKRVDVIPASLTLAQAATESAWGQSRFALEANNLFGIWTYDKSKGLEPLERDQDKKHLVRKFSDVRESVSYYMHTLNTHPAYRQLREIRYRMRMNNEQPDGHTLASGLEKYSAKGEHYIQLIRDLIRQNQWARLDQAPHTG